MQEERETTQKIPFSYACADASFTPTGLAMMAGVSTCMVYAMLKGEPVPRDKAEATLNVLSKWSAQGIRYTLDNVDIVLKGEEHDRAE